MTADTGLWSQTYTPLAGAAFLVLPGEEDIVAAAGELAA